MKKQGIMLMDVLNKCVAAVENLEEVVPNLQNLAIRHINYGAVNAQYSVVGDCLLYTLEKGLGNEWNNEVKDVWSKTYGIIQKVMTDAVDKHQAK